MNFIGANRAGRGLADILFLGITAILLSAVVAEASEIPGPKGDTGFSDVTVNEWRSTLHADLFARLNPNGVMLSVGDYRRLITGKDEKTGLTSSYLQGGFALGVNPAYGQASIHIEWMPAIFATIRLQYDLYRYFGTNGALLSFPDADAKFGKDQINALSGKEESGFGHRIMVRPTVYVRKGPVVVRNQTDLAYYRFDGKGPYFYEWEYDTLLKDGDLLLDNRTALLYEGWKGRNDASLLVGPFYEITHAGEADLTRQRMGGQLFWMPAESLWSLNRPRIYSQVGVNLQDPNRKGEMFVTIGFGFDYDL
jgi:hypothetical protein